MQIFLVEHLTSGAVADGETPLAALATEGAAMLRALAADAANVPSWSVAVLWARSLGPFGVPGVEVLSPTSLDDEARLFIEHTSRADRTLVIAPESEEILEDRCKYVLQFGGRSAGSTPEAITLCGDKLALAEHFTRHGVPTIETHPCDFDEVSAAIHSRSGGSFVVKPRHGAGAVHTFHIRGAGELIVASMTFAMTTDSDEPIVQPYMAGTPLSVAAIVSPRGTELFPIARQKMTGKNRFHYAGGSISTAGRRSEAVLDVARRAIKSVPGLSGYVGVDLIVPADRKDEPLVVEINPRLTTSYLGYRMLTDDNLAERLLTPEVPRPPIIWNRGRVEFQTDGAIVPKK